MNTEVKPRAKKRVPCIRVFVRRDVCKVILARGQYHHSKDLGVTGRGDMVFGEYDKKGRLIGLELIGDDKRCQRSARPKRAG